MAETQRLSEQELALWTRYLRVQKQLFAALNRQLQVDAGLSLTDWDVLTALSADAAGAQGVGELAHTLGWERSRLSHHATRMQQRGLLRRQVNPEDRRSATYALTAAGWRASREAAAKHVQTVRQLFLAPLNATQVRAMTQSLQRILDQFDAVAPG